MGFIKFLKKKNEQESVPEPPQRQPMDQPEIPPAPQMNTPTEDDFPPPPAFNSPEQTDSLPDFPEIKHDSEGIPPPPEEQSFESPSEFEALPVPEEQPIQEEPVQEPMTPPIEEEPIVDEKPIMSETEIISQVNEQKPEPEYEEDLEVQGPLFIKSENFQRVLGRIKTTKDRMKEFEDRVFSLNELKTKEEKKYSLWKSKLEDIQRKMIYVDKILFEKP